MHRSLFEYGWHVRAKVFDGLIIEPGEFGSSVSEALGIAEKACLAQGWNIRLIEKPLKDTHDKIMPSLDISQRAIEALMKKRGNSMYSGSYSVYA